MSHSRFPQRSLVPPSEPTTSEGSSTDMTSVFSGLYDVHLDETASTVSLSDTLAYSSGADSKQGDAGSLSVSTAMPFVEQSSPAATPLMKSHIGTLTSLPDLLDILAHLLREVAIPLPGLHGAAVPLAEVVERIQAIPATEMVWNRLSVRLDQLCRLVYRIHDNASLEESIRRVLLSISEKLLKLSRDIRKNSKKKQRFDFNLFPVAKLFNTKLVDTSSRVSGYEKRVDRLNSILTNALCSYTVTDRSEQMQVPSLHIPAGSIEMSNNHGLDIGGAAFSGLQFAREMRVQIHHNSAVRTRGDAFCNINFQ